MIKKKISKKESAAARTLAAHYANQKLVALVQRDASAMAFINDFLTWHDTNKFPLHHQYQPQCIRLIAGSTHLNAYFEMGCGSGKTLIFCLATLVRAYLDGTPIVMIAPRLDLLRQVYNVMQETKKLFNLFLTSIGCDTIESKTFNVSSDRSFSKEPTEEELLEREAQTDIEDVVETLSNSDEVAEALADRVCGGDLILVCNDSFEKFMLGFNKKPIDCSVVFDEFHTKQTSEALRACAFAQLKRTLNSKCSCVISMSATPKVNVEHGTSAELALETDIWGVNGVWHAIQTSVVSAKQLRAWEILKTDMAFHWGLSSSPSVEEEIRGWLNDSHHVADAEECVKQIALFIAFGKRLTLGSTGLVFVRTVAHITAFMSDECRPWREKLENKYNLRFHESHAGTSRQDRDKIKDVIEEDEDKNRKHVILNHSTWLMGMDFPRISWVMVLRNMSSDNLVQAISRATRKFGGVNTCNVVLPFNPNGEQAKELIEKMYGLTEGDVKHYLIPHEDERVGGLELEEDDLLVSGDEVEITLDHGDAEIVTAAEMIAEFEEDLAHINQLKRIARQESTRVW